MIKNVLSIHDQRMFFENIYSEKNVFYHIISVIVFIHRQWVCT